MDKFLSAFFTILLAIVTVNTLIHDGILTTWSIAAVCATILNFGIARAAWS